MNQPYRPQDFRFERVRQDRSWRELEQIKLPESWAKLALEGLGLALFLAFVVLIVMRG